MLRVSRELLLLHSFATEKSYEITAQLSQQGNYCNGDYK